MKYKTMTILFCFMAIAAMFIACQRPSGKESKNSITIKGSDTMVHLVTAWAEKYMEIHPESSLSVTGGGSGTGIAAMINGSTDLAMASRKFKKAEIDLAQAKGITPVEHVTALDGIAVVVNPDNPVSELTLEQLKQIFTGIVTDWQQITKGDSRPIIVLSRESNSGTYVYFQEEVLEKQDYFQKVRLMPSNSAIIQSAEQDSGAIGYVGVAYAANSRAKIVRVKKSEDSQAINPDMENIKNNNYPIARPLLLYTKGQPEGQIKDFLDFVSGPDGQAIVKKIGYVPVS